MIVLLGYSASGKDSILRHLKAMGYEGVTSWTTRPKRPNEVGGVDYNFVTDEEFKTLDENGFFAETTTYVMAGNHTVHYGSAIEDLSMHKAIILNPEGFRKLKNIPSLNVVSFYVTCSEDELRNRLKGRGDDPAEYERRLAADRRDFSGLVYDVDFVVRNEGRLTPQICAEMINYLYKKKVGEVND